MNEKSSNKPPTWYWVVTVLALLWNLVGVWAYLGSAFMKDEIRADLSPEQVVLFDSTPAWVTAAFAIATWGGLLGCIALLLRKKWAKPVLTLSLLGILVQMSHGFFMTNSIELYGQVQGLIVPLFVIIIGIALVLFARTADKKLWLS